MALDAARLNLQVAMFIGLALLMAGCATQRRGVEAVGARSAAYNRPYSVRGRTYTPSAAPGYDEVGLASWYGYESGGRTSDGEAFTLTDLTAAHRTLPIPSVLEVTNLENGRRVRVRLNDRGPFQPGRLIDLSHEAARQLGFLARGTARVRVRYLGPPTGRRLGLETSAGVGRDMEANDIVGAALRAPRDLQGWIVQAAAFRDAERAARAAAALASAGPTRISAAEAGGHVLYQVIVTPGDGVSAEETRQRVALLGFAGARVIAVD